MSRFTLDAGEGAAAAGTGLGNIFKAFVLGPQARQQAEMEAAKNSADIYYRNMAGNKFGAEAEGLGLTNKARTEPIDTSLPQYLQGAQRLFQMTGDTNADRVARAGTEIQTQDIRSRALQSVNDLETMNRLNTLAKPGETYMPFDDVGTTGYSLNKASGAQIVGNPVLARLFGDKTGSEITENRAQANSANAAAGKYGAEAGLVTDRRNFLKDNGRLPGTAGGGEDATNAKTRNSIIAAVERELPGATEAEIAAEVEKRLARRGMGQNKNPPAPGAQPKMPLPQGVTPELAIQQARAAIAAGKDRNAVIQRLRDMGVDPKGL